MGDINDYEYNGVRHFVNLEVFGLSCASVMMENSRIHLFYRLLSWIARNLFSEVLIIVVRIYTHRVPRDFVKSPQPFEY